MAHKVDPLVSRNVLVVNGREVPALLKKGTSGESYKVGRVQMAYRTVIPPNSKMRVEGEVDGQFSGDCVISPSWAKHGLAIPYTAVTVNKGRVVTQVTNLSDNFITLKKGTTLGSIENAEEVTDAEAANSSSMPGSSVQGIPGEHKGTSCRETDSNTMKGAAGTKPMATPPSPPNPFSTLEEVMSNIPEHMQDMFKSSCEHLTDDQAVQFGNLLQEFLTIFTCEDTDLGSFTGIEHHIDTDA